MSVDQVLNVYFPTNKSHEITCETECIMRDSKKDKNYDFSCHYYMPKLNRPNAR